jgi:hypothetical protein
MQEKTPADLHQFGERGHGTGLRGRSVEHAHEDGGGAAAVLDHASGEELAALLRGKGRRITRGKHSHQVEGWWWHVRHQRQGQQ